MQMCIYLICPYPYKYVKIIICGQTNYTVSYLLLNAMGKKEEYVSENDWRADFFKAGEEGISEEITLGSVMNIEVAGIMHRSGIAF